MKRDFYNLDGQMITSCECYVDAPCCMALKGLQYKIRYSRSKDTETIYFKTNLNPDTFKSTIVFLKSDLNIELGANCKPIKDNRCGVNAQFPNKTVACDTNFVFLKNNKAFHTTYCTKSLKTNMENRSLFCPILAEFNKHNILYSVQSQDVLQSKAKINIITTDIIPVHDKWVLDTIYMQGLCAGCKWHKRTNTGAYEFHRTNHDICGVSRDKCSAIKMLENGYTNYEAKVRCLACYHTLKQIHDQGK